MIDEKLLIDIRNYLKMKTGIYYFKDIRKTPDNLQVTCPYHKGGQERKPSATIRITPSNRTTIGMFHCFTCDESKPLDIVIKDLLGPLYDEDEVESLFNLKTLIVQSQFEYKKKEPLFKIPNRNIIPERVLRTYRYYHPYLASRNISEETADIYDIGFDAQNNQITFPIRNINKECLGIGRRSIDKKMYRYPSNFIKPLYGVYELNQFLNYVYVVEGPFNLWSLREFGKQGVALLGTGTEKQYKELSNLNCKGFVLALDPDDAGRHGIFKLGKFLQENKIKTYVALIPEGKDVNDLSKEEFSQVAAVTFKEWLLFYYKDNVRL